MEKPSFGFYASDIIIYYSKIKHVITIPVSMAPPDRLELPTNGLTVRCSTTLS